MLDMDALITEYQAELNRTESDLLEADRETDGSCMDSYRTCGIMEAVAVRS